MATGIVNWFDKKKGIGFVTNNDGSGDVFVHYSVIAGTGFRNLVEGQTVTFDVENSSLGPLAVNVTV
ncbi:MAG: cold-shock protein [Gammaproteobacteria bacterium]|jgi:CspA family cold shock protein